jgi:hypothetical protein
MNTIRKIDKSPNNEDLRIDQVVTSVVSLATLQKIAKLRTLLSN